MPSTTMIRRSAATMAVVASAALFTPALAVAEPVAPEAVTVTAQQTPDDGALKAAITELAASAGDPVALAAAKALLGSTPQIQSTPSAEITATPAAEATDFAALLAAANDALEGLGIQSFINPTVAFNCVDPTESNPFGLAAAVGGAAPGPFAVPGVTLPDWLEALLPANFSPNIVDDGETLFGFFPAGITADGQGTGMQVAWFNVNTFQGGFVDMAPVGTTIVEALLDRLPAAVPTAVRTALEAQLTPLANALSVPGSRLAPVETGNGTVLSAVFGTVQNGDRSCFFLPMIGITQV